MFQQPSVSLKMREFIPYVSIAYTQVNATFENTENILKLKQSYLQVWTRNIQISPKINAPYLGKTKAKKNLEKTESELLQRWNTHCRAGSVSDLNHTGRDYSAEAEG